jgi:hypothetical protein
MEKPRFDRCFQLLLMASTAGVSWLLMMGLHECGHILHGCLSGARLAGMRLPIWGFSQTHFAANPHPLFVVWGGPLWGCLFPLVILAGARLMRRVAHRDEALSASGGRDFLMAWFAGFCLIANGSYLLGGAFMSGGADDAGVILQSGGARWQLVAFGLPAIAAGLYLWNGLGPCFGLGPAHGKVDRKAAVGVAIVLLGVVLTLALLQKPGLLV